MTEKTDRELLELAAKAAGYVVWSGRGHQEDMLFMRLKKPDPTGKCSGREWNPLSDDGDALLLAVALGLRISTDSRSGLLKMTEVIKGYGVQADEHGRVELHGDDPFYATRRAIVRAAAAIGEAMQ